MFFSLPEPVLVSLFAPLKTLVSGPFIFTLKKKLRRERQIVVLLCESITTTLKMSLFRLTCSSIIPRTIIRTQLRTLTEEAPRVRRAELLARQKLSGKQPTFKERMMAPAGETGKFFLSFDWVIRHDRSNKLSKFPNFTLILRYLFFQLSTLERLLSREARL